MINDNGKNVALDALGTNADFLAAHTAVPNASGDAEVTGGSYARQGIVWNAAASGAITLNGAESIPIPAATTVVALGLWSAATVGTYYGHALIGNTITGFGMVDATDVTNNTITSNGHGLSNTNRVVVYNVLAESLLAGLTEGTVYYVVGSATDTFQVSLTSGGAAVDITGQGELFFANCVPETFANAGTLEIATTALTVSAVVI